LPGLRSFGELALRIFAALVLPLVFDGRAISAPRGSTRPSYRAKPSFWKGPNEPDSCLPTAQIAVRSGPWLCANGQVGSGRSRQSLRAADVLESGRPISDQGGIAMLMGLLDTLSGLQVARMAAIRLMSGKGQRRK
jgi:hypothetical protein